MGFCIRNAMLVFELIVKLKSTKYLYLNDRQIKLPPCVYMCYEIIYTHILCTDPPLNAHHFVPNEHTYGAYQKRQPKPVYQGSANFVPNEHTYGAYQKRQPKPVYQGSANFVPNEHTYGTYQKRQPEPVYQGGANLVFTEHNKQVLNVYVYTININSTIKCCVFMM